MLLTSHALATATVRCAAMGLAPHRVEALLPQPRNGPVRTVITISQYDIATLYVMLLLAKQRHFTGRFALVTPHPERRQGATAEVKACDKTRTRKASTGLLAQLRGIGGLIGLSIGH